MSPMEGPLKSSHLFIQTGKQTRRVGTRPLTHPAPPGSRPRSARARQRAPFPAVRARGRLHQAGPLRKTS